MLSIRLLNFLKISFGLNVSSTSPMIIYGYVHERMGLAVQKRKKVVGE